VVLSGAISSTGLEVLARFLFGFVISVLSIDIFLIIPYSINWSVVYLAYQVNLIWFTAWRVS